ncbi:CAP domain-containing protein [Lactobacillus isalae]|uniref:CAP domain-containing protein n=1 Tax=Lactobacillus isalae TaxID=2993455 RepID=UPI0024A99FFD|nr:CAP domain-containing protein [Lactobacillus isalae]
MTFTKKAAIFLATITLSATSCTVIATSTQATTFTKDEIQEVHNIQNQYSKLPKETFSSNNLYATAPHLSAPFSPGAVTNSYINSQLDYINFYRSLFDLPSISTNKTDNDNAQITASVMAAIKANPFTNQHGLPSETRPAYISDTYWTIAKNVSASSNLNFNVSNQSAGDVITDLLTDTYNLDGSDTGHRAWLLSSRLTTTGIGAAYGENNYRYSVQQVAYPSDGYKAAAKGTVAYPNSGVFPIELLQGNNIAWSLYLSDKTISATPKITVTDLDTGETSQASNVNNFSGKGYGYFSTIITYFPGDIKLVSGHEYNVNIDNVYQYSFKLFNQVAANQPTLKTSEDSNKIKEKIKNSGKISSSQNIKDNNDQTTRKILKEVEDPSSSTTMKSALLLQGEELRDSLNKKRRMNPVIFGRSYQDGYSYYNLGNDQWFHNFYIFNNPDLTAGVVNIDNHSLDTQIYTSPYLHLQKSTPNHVIPGKSYAYGQTITTNHTTWYYLGKKQWIKQNN